jgi:hypothetical protein
MILITASRPLFFVPQEKYKIYDVIFARPVFVDISIIFRLFIKISNMFVH